MTNSHNRRTKSITGFFFGGRGGGLGFFSVFFYKNYRAVLITATFQYITSDYYYRS